MIWTIPIFVPMHCLIGILVYLTKTQYRIRKYVDLCTLKIDNSFITNQWQVTNCFQSRDLVLSCRCVEHFFECEIFCVRDGKTIVQVILSHEYCLFHCYSHEHSPNHRMFFFFFCNIWNSFLSFSHLIIHPIHEWSWCYWPNWWTFETTSMRVPMHNLIVGSRSPFQDITQNLKIRKPSRARDWWLLHHQSKKCFHEESSQLIVFTP